MITETSIINSMLRAVGESAITAAASSHPTVLDARTTLTKENITMQATGWWFNKEYSFALTPTVAGEIILPSNLLNIVVHEDGERYVQRGARLYDSFENTYVIGRGLTADMILELPIDELPNLAAAYLEALAVERFFTEESADQVKLGMYQQAKIVAETRLRDAEYRASKLSVLNRPGARAMRSFYGIRGRNPNIPGG